MTHGSLLSDLEQARAMIMAGKLADAARLARALIERHPLDHRPWHLMSLVHAKGGRLADAIGCIDRAVAMQPGDPGLRLQHGQYLIGLGRRREALVVAERISDEPLERADWSDALGTLWTLCDEPARALPFLERAVAQAPNDSRYLYNLAAVQRMIGEIAAAEATLNQVIAAQPANAYAYYTRADLRTQTSDDNHIAQMIGAFDAHVQHLGDRIMMCFAIAKELDDVGRYTLSFDYLRRGNDQQRRLFTYDVADDTATIDRIIALHGPAVINAACGHDTSECIFVMGLPRTGTTLVEQILASHSAIHGAGELHAFPLAVVDAARQLAGRAVAKLELAEWALRIDPQQLGRAYIQATRPQTGRTPYFVDKPPGNYLYAGLIRRALPRARLIVVARDPVDSCFAMYRTLFTSAYPFSYTLAELATYYAAWHRLIRHWRAVLGDTLLIVRYEDLVNNLEPTVRQLIAHCGLEWEDACLSFHRHSRTVATASAVQVRRPIYGSSVGKWKNYREQLAPLVAMLQQLEPAGGWT